MLFAYLKDMAEVQEKVFLEFAATWCYGDHPMGGSVCPHCIGNLYTILILFSSYSVLYLVVMGRN